MHIYRLFLILSMIFLDYKLPSKNLAYACPPSAGGYWGLQRWIVREETTGLKQGGAYC